VPEGFWRFVIGEPELALSEKFGNYQVRFPLHLSEADRKLVADENPLSDEDKAEGVQQSWRVSYTVGLSLGYVQRDGQFKSTKLVDFLAACLGQESSKRFYKWVAEGGGPPRPADKDDQKAELDCIADWLGWWQELEVLGAVRHNTAESGNVYANFAGPVPVGSIRDQKDPEYQAHGRGKLKAIIAQYEAGESKGIEPDPPVQYTAQGQEVRHGSDMPEANNQGARRGHYAGRADSVATPAEVDDELPF
jgi:hypothetical protein